MPEVKESKDKKINYWWIIFLITILVNIGFQGWKWIHKKDPQISPIIDFSILTLTKDELLKKYPDGFKKCEPEPKDNDLLNCHWWIAGQPIVLSDVVFYKGKVGYIGYRVNKIKFKEIINLVQNVKLPPQSTSTFEIVPGSHTGVSAGEFRQIINAGGSSVKIVDNESVIDSEYLAMGCWANRSIDNGKTLLRALGGNGSSYLFKHCTDEVLNNISALSIQILTEDFKNNSKSIFNEK